VDFFTPVVDDPYWFGQIAAANALSDIYAMGGVPKTALNLVAFPVKQMDMEILRHIIRGGLEKVKEAGAVLIGGHSVEDNELKYGLSVTGFIHPDRVLTNRGLRSGDSLILTKPLGSGIINTAIKGGLASNETIRSVTRLMATLNRDSAEIMKDHPVHACTDITGFGLLGHVAEMVTGTNLGVDIQADKVPIIQEALKFAGMGLVPAGTYANRAFRDSMVSFASTVESPFQDILFDPQTSGGLLMSVDAQSADDLLAQLKKKGIHEAAMIGTVTSGKDDKSIVVR
jgi:selenide,water dikinase